MKTTTILGLFIYILSFSAYSQDVFIYGRNGSKEYFERIDSIVQIKFKDGVGNSEKLAIAQSINSKVDYSTILEGNRICIPVDRKNLPDYKELNSNNSLIYANQSLQYDDGTIQIPTDKVLARIKEGYKIKEVLFKLNIKYESFRRIGHNVNSYLIVLKDGASVKTANLLYESGYFKHAQPSFARLMTSLNTHYIDQWGLNNTGQYGGTNGIDIHAQEAWGITEGCDDIVVAVLDQGVDLDHPDLADNLLTGYDATDGSDGAVNGDCSGNHAHGTCCAGIIGSIDNSIGTKGVAPNCRIMSIRIGIGDVFYDDEEIEGMNYAWDTAGADVISCSWGGGSNNEDLYDEISYALELGRDSLGCVVVFAAGNDNRNSVSYPANSYPDIIAVGAMSPCGQRKTPSSCDTEDEWGSNYGDDLDLIAPGVLIPTTDIQDAAGYNTTLFIHTAAGGSKISSDYNDDDYTVCFNGTSAATPHVAGVAALILSVNPELTQDEVRDIIESTCTKVGNYNYTTVTGRTNGTWDDEVGYGCLNAYAAVSEASGGNISGPDVVCTSNTTFSLTGVTSGLTIDWDCDTSVLTQVSDDDGSSYVVHANSSSTSGEGWVRVRIITSCDDTITQQKTVWVGKPNPNDFYVTAVDNYGSPIGSSDGPFQVCPNNYYTFYLYPSYNLSENHHRYGISDIDFYFDFNYDIVTGGYGWAYVYVNYIDGDSYGLVDVDSDCGYMSEFKVVEVNEGYCGQYLMTFTPNPTTGETTLSIESEEKIFDETAEWNLEIYSESQLLKEKKNNLRGKSTKIQTAGWKEGVYMVRVKYKDEILTGKLVVKK